MRRITLLVSLIASFVASVAWMQTQPPAAARRRSSPASRRRWTERICPSRGATSTRARAPTGTATTTASCCSSKGRMRTQKRGQAMKELGPGESDYSGAERAALARRHADAGAGADQRRLQRRREVAGAGQRRGLQRQEVVSAASARAWRRTARSSRSRRCFATRHRACAARVFPPVPARGVAASDVRLPRSRTRRRRRGSPDRRVASLTSRPGRARAPASRPASDRSR